MTQMKWNLTFWACYESVIDPVEFQSKTQTVYIRLLPLKTATPLLWHGAQRQGLASARYSDSALFRFLFRVASLEKSLEVTSSYSGRV